MLGSGEKSTVRDTVCVSDGLAECHGSDINHRMGHQDPSVVTIKEISYCE